MYYGKFEQLLQKNGITPYKVGKDLKISNSILSEWKTGKKTPKADKLQKIAEYFGVSIGYFFDEDIKKEPIQRMDKFSQMFYALDDEDRQEIIDIMQMKLSKSKYKKAENVG